MSSVKWCSVHVAKGMRHEHSRHRRSRERQVHRDVPFPRSAILTVIFSVPSSMLEVVDVSAKLGWGDSPDMMDVESLVSEEIVSPEPVGFVVDGACDCEGKELAVG
jgi:hypothetical protein